jgi:hypothetical protein
MNAKSIKRFLPLRGEVSMSKNHSVPNDEWDEVEYNNSPIHNDALCPLFYTESKTDNPSITDKYGNIYTTENGYFTRNSAPLFEVNNERFVKKEVTNEVLSCYYDGFIYKAYHSGSNVIIEKSSDGGETWEHHNSVVNSSFAINVIERLWHGHYAALTIYNGRTSIIFDNHIQYISDRGTWLPNTESPIMTLTEYEPEHYLIYICNKSGAIVRATDIMNGDNLVCRFISFNETDGFTIVNRKSWDTTIEVPSGETDLKIYATTAQISMSNIGMETRMCYKQNDNYYDAETHELLTFSPGYAPQAASSQYRYTTYTTRYHYDYVLTYDGHIGYAGSSMPEGHLIFDIKLMNAPHPVNTQMWHKEMTVTDWNNASFSFDIDVKNNYGYIMSADMVNFAPVFNIHHAEAVKPDMTFDVPAEYTGVSGMGIYNRPAKTTANDFWAVWTYRYSSSEYTVNHWDGTHSYMPDDSEYIYPFYNVASGTQLPGVYTYYNAKATFEVSYDTLLLKAVKLYSLASDSTNPYGGYLMAAYASIGYGYFRHVFLTKETDTAFEDDVYTGGRFAMYDMTSDIILGRTGAYRTADVGYEDKKINAFYLPTGVKADKDDAFTPLFNNGYVSGISYNSTLVTPWLSINTQSPFYCDGDVAYYRDVDTNKWILIRKEQAAPSLTLVENRYIVLNTTSYWNCYDTRLGEKTKYAYDWNNRVFFTGSFNDGIENIIYGSGYNISYSVINKNSGITSAAFAAVPLCQCSVYKMFVTSEKMNIDFYKTSYSTTSNIAPVYETTFHNIESYKFDFEQLQINDSDLSYYKSVYPLYSGTSMMRNPSIFAEWVLSGNNQDYMIDGNNGYQVLYEDTEPMILTAATGSIKGMESIFVIQSMPYAVLNGKIYSLNYLNGGYQGRDCIININGMKYIGAIPSRAYFYSPNNRAIYIFTGDANLTKAKDASAISDIYYITMNPATQTIYMATNDGLYMISDQHSFKQTFYNVQSITFIDDGTVSICHKQNDGYTNTRFYYEDADGRTTNKVIYDSGLLGAGEHKVFTIDKYNISLFSDQKRNGVVKVRSVVLLDNGQKQEEDSTIKINKADWDDMFHSRQIDFTPKYNKGVGVGIMIESDFAISNITASCTVEPATNNAGTKWSI